MHQLSRSIPTNQPPSTLGSAELALLGESESTRRSPALVFWERRWSIAACIVIAVAGAIGYLATATPIYEGVAKIAVDQGGQPRVLNDIAGTSQGQNWLQTQAEMIRSGEILGKVAALPEIAQMETFRGSPSVVSDLQSRVQAVVSTRSDVISISARSANHTDAAVIANSVAAEYQNYVNQRRRRTAADVLRMLETQKSAAENDLRAKRDDKVKFVRETGLVPGTANPTLQRIQSLSTERNRLELQLNESSASLRAAKEAVTDPSKAEFLIESVLANNRSGLTGQIRQEIRIRQRELLAMGNNYLPGFPDLDRIRIVLKSLQEELAAEDKRLLEIYVAQLERNHATLQFRLDEITRLVADAMADYRRFNEQSLQLEILESEIRRLESQAGSYDSQIRSLDLTTRDADFAANITIMERASETARNMVAPKQSMTLASALVAGLLAGSLLAFLRDWLDQRLRSAEEIKQVLNLQVLGVVPHIHRARTPSDRGTVVQHEPMSDVAESYRTVRTAVYFGVPAGAARTLLVTSPQPGDGKTTLASNLAIAMAQAGNRVLLIDADFRKPMQHKIFNTPRETGVSSVLAGEMTLDDAVQDVGIEGLSLLPCGPIPANPSEILNSKAFGELMEQLKSRFDQIIVDSPPVLPVTDARILAASCDLTVLALRAEKSTRRAATYARDVLLSVGASVLGVVVNDVPRHRGSYGYGRGGYMYAYGYGNATRRVAPTGGTRQIAGELTTTPNGNGESH